MKYSEQDMLRIVNEVEQEFAEYLNKNEATENNEQELQEEVIETIEKNEVSENYSDEELEELNKIYASMKKSEAEIHYLSLKKALFGSEEEMTKSEMTKSEDMYKAEISTLNEEKENLSKENSELKKNLEEIKSSLNSFIASRAPQRKAITDVEILRKNDVQPKELTKAEVDSKIKSIVRNPSLTKSDREAINDYYFNGSVEKIKHLL
jgi:chromosome segregation ATPase